MPLQGRKRPGAERGVGKLAQSDRDIYAVGDQVLIEIRNAQLHAQHGIASEKLGKARNDFARAKDHRQSEADCAAQRIDAACCVLRVIQFRKDVARSFEELRPRAREGKPPSRPQQELDA